MMNSGKLRMATQIGLWETKFQKYQSSTILQKANKEDNKLEKQNRQKEYYKRTSFVWVPPLFVHFEADFDCISDSGDIWRLCKYEHMPLLSENTLPVK